MDRISKSWAEKDSALLPALRLAAAEICAVRGQRKLWLRYRDVILTSPQKVIYMSQGQKMPWRNLSMADNYLENGSKPVGIATATPQHVRHPPAT